MPASIATDGAAASMMHDTPPPSPADPSANGADAPPPKPASPLTQTIRLVVGAGLCLVFGLIAISKFATRNDLPGCDGRPTKDVLSNIFKSKQVDVKRYDAITTNDKSADRLTCMAAMTMADDHKAEIDYEITRVEGGRFQVRVTGGRDE